MRPWNELVADWGDLVPLSLTALVLLLVALIIGLLWFFWPRWFKALTRKRAPDERQAKDEATPEAATEPSDDETPPAADDSLPDLHPAVLTDLADRYAADGRYAEAVRERLRAMVRELVDQGVVVNHPGWTVTELAEAAGAAKPAVRPPVTNASTVFSDIWYGKRPARSDHDSRMREFAQQLHAEMSRR